MTPRWIGIDDTYCYLLCITSSESNGFMETDSNMMGNAITIKTIRPSPPALLRGWKLVLFHHCCFVVNSIEAKLWRTFIIKERVEEHSICHVLWRSVTWFCTATLHRHFVLNLVISNFSPKIKSKNTLRSLKWWSELQFGCDFPFFVHHLMFGVVFMDSSPYKLISLSSRYRMMHYNYRSVLCWSLYPWSVCVVPLVLSVSYCLTVTVADKERFSVCYCLLCPHCS